MGAGRKTQTLRLKEKSQPRQKINSSVSARNLRKSDLGAVIFGCKNYTITECKIKQLFGLPFSHFSYVKNVTPGLTLFLFNYSDRKLHGIFEAASPGQLNINPNGWTVNGEESTPYPAQVRIHVRKQCRTLQEEEFGPIIADNYYEESLFWFELDHKQTRRLIDLFLSSPSTKLSTSLHNVARWNTLLNGIPSSDGNEASGGARGSDNQHKVDGGQVTLSSSPHNEMNLAYETSYASVLGQLNASLPQKSWSSLFKNSAASDAINKEENLKTTLNTQGSESLPVVDQSNTDWGSTSVPSFPERHGPHFEDSADAWDVEEDEEPVKHGEHCEAPQAIWNTERYAEPAKQDEYLEGSIDTWDAEEYGESVDWKLTHIPSSVPAIAANSLPLDTSHACLQIMDPREEGGCFRSVASDLLLQQSHEQKRQWETLCAPNVSDGGCQLSDISMHSNMKDVQNEASIHEGGIALPLHADVEFLEEMESSTALAVGELRSSDIPALVAKLIREIGEMKGLQLKQNQKINSLEQELLQSKLEIQQMRNQYTMFASRQTFSSSGQFQGIDCRSSNGLPEFDDSILIAGGYDGSSWLLALSSYSPSSDLIKSLTPMNFMRSHTSAAKLNGEFYLLGGVNGDVWYDTVESFNPRSSRWYIRPPLNRRKGSLAAISVSEKLFAIGGGNGVECFAEVEMFDTNIGKWTYTQSMQHKRFAPAVADIDGTIYVVGGCDGSDYLKSVERFDPREHKWTELASMKTRRGCHSLVALNGKLYALGGYNEEKMVSTVEIFDPRACSWMIGESMKAARGYSGAAVIGEKIYVIGGLKNSEVILDTVEFYKEGYGWQLTNSKAVGKRCFFSALVL